MRVLPPITSDGLVITEAMLTSSTVAETEPQWNSLTTYGVGDIVRGSGADVHRLFESLTPNNQNSPLSDTTKWLDAGPSNRWRMFDLLRSTGSTGPSPMTVVLTPGKRTDAVGLVGLIADKVTISVTAGGNVVYTATQILSTRAITNWYEYFFSEFSYQQALAKFDLPPFANAIVTFTFERANGDVTVGGVLIGTSVFIGVTQHEAESDVENFSRIDRTDFGTAILVPRRSVPRTNQTVWCTKAEVNKVIAVRDALNAVPALWSGIDDAQSGYFEASLILGIYKRFSINMAYPNDALITLELEEV